MLDAQASRGTTFPLIAWEPFLWTLKVGDSKGLEGKENTYPVFKLTKASSTPFWLYFTM